MRLQLLAFASICGLIVASVPSRAQTLPDANNPAVKAAASACAVDIQKFCAGVQQGGGRILRCLGASRDGLSAGCRSSILQAKSALGR